jgi:DNA (cytosine-5)-methyltransferase 1
MQIIDTFSGVGGFSLAGEWMGWRTVQFVEINPFGQRVLKYYWPDVPIHNDIKTITAEQIINNGLYDANETTIFTGGVPCQPWSQAGKRLGKEDDRDLWEETIKLIGTLKPEWAVLENVSGLVNWNGGMVFNEVQADLEAEGYEVIPFLLPAAGVNAPHKRERVWFVARRLTPDTNLHGHELRGPGEDRQSEGKGFGEGDKRERLRSHNRGTGEQGIVADTASEGREEREQPTRRKNEEENGTGMDDRPERHGSIGLTPDSRNQGLQGGKFNGAFEKKGQIGREQSPRPTSKLHQITNWSDFPTQSPVRFGNDGVSYRLDRETIQNLLKGRQPREPWIPFAKWRNESIKGYGNAVCPQVVLQIFKAIQEFESSVKKS